MSEATKTLEAIDGIGNYEYGWAEIGRAHV